MVQALFVGSVESVAGHWTQFTILVSSRLVVSGAWQARNKTNKDALVYMELEVIRPMYPSPQRLVSTLPGTNSFTTEMTRSLVLFTVAPIFTISGGQVGDVTAQVQLAAGALPEGVHLDVRMRLRRVDNQGESSDPARVGPVIENGEHKQDNVIIIASQAQLEAYGLPDMNAFT